MSGIPGVFFRAPGWPAKRGPDLLRAMCAAAPHRGPDGVRCVSDGPVTLGHQQLRTLSEDPPGEQPLVDGARGQAITFDGRLDERDAVLSQLGSVETASSGSDASLVLAAYRKWGTACPEHLNGDFVFAIWDRARRQLFCARDRMGIKPFYYFADPTRFFWGSDIRQVLAAGVTPEPNEAMVAEYLAFSISSETETLYRGVMRLPPAHAMTVTADRVSIRRYWQLDPSAEIHHATDREYAEHFRSIFDRAVEDRLRALEPIGAYLSGGLDSSSVVGTACTLGTQPETFSLIYPHRPSADESPYIDAVVARWGLVSHKTPANSIDGRRCRELVRGRLDVLDLPADLEGESLSFAMRDRGMRVVLTGAGGDYGLSGSVYRYADLLRKGQLGALLQLMSEDRRVSGDWPFAQVFAFGVRPLIPQALRTAVRPLARRMGWLPEPPGWISDALAQRVSLADRIRPPVPPDAVGDFSRRDIWGAFRSGWASRLLETAERSAAEFGIDERHPFFDRRVVEFVLAIPDTQRWRGQTAKYVLRGAMGDRLPPSVYHRTDKADFSPVVPNGVEAVGGGSFLENLTIVDRGWVNQARVADMHLRASQLLAAGDPDYCMPMFRLWMIAGVELWYRAVFVEGDGHVRSGTRELGGACRSDASEVDATLSAAAAH